MTTTCLPCELAAAEAAEDVIPKTTGETAAWSGPIGIENQTTGDGRHINSNALRWDTLPVPLRWAMQDFGAHDGAYVVGKIAGVERLSYEETNKRLVADGRDPLPESFADAIIIWGSGTYDLGSEYGREAFRQVDEELTPGISMDLDDVVIEEDDSGGIKILEARVRAATQVAIPAFEGARIATTRSGRVEAVVDEETFNWVEDAGGLPSYIKRIEKHLQKKGMPESQAIATAVNVVKKMCASGDLNFPGAQQVNAGSRAEACAAVAEWEAKKAKAKTNAIGQTVEGVKVQPPPNEPETKKSGTKEQVRVPKGNPDGGRWMDTPGSVAEESDEALARAEWLEDRDELRSTVREAAEALAAAKIGTPAYQEATEGLRAALGTAQEQIKGMTKVGKGAVDKDAAKDLISALEAGEGKLAEYLRTDWSLQDEESDIGSHALVASAGTVFPYEWFQDPHLTEPTGFTVTEDGRVFGHIAIWGTCHIASPQGKHVCTQPPRSPSNYSRFHTGVAPTTMGDVPCGKITMSTLHAGQRLSANDTVYHYEHTGAVGALVVAGEDSHGIWVAGAAHPKADLLSLKAAPISGDWRTYGRELDLAAALSVNVPGFPVPRAKALVAGGQVISLVASGVVEAEQKMENVMALDDTMVLALRERFHEMDRREKADALAARVSRLAALEKVRRLATTLPKFAYNPDQWRVPKGNPKGGQWIDMPDLAVNDLNIELMNVFETADVDENAATEIGTSLSSAVDDAERASQALRDLDGDSAVAAATEADEALSLLETQLMDQVDSGAIDEDRAAVIGEKLAAAREAVTTVRDADLSLLGDEGIGSDDEGSDIGGEGEAVVGDAPEGIPRPDNVDAEGNIAWGERFDGVWPVLNSLPDGAVIRTTTADPQPGTEDMGVEFTKVNGDWVVSKTDFPDEAPLGEAAEGDSDFVTAGGDHNVQVLKGFQDSGDGTPDEDDGRDDFWSGFEEQYIRSADPDRDINPDELREDYDRLIDEEGKTPEEALQEINNIIRENRAPLPDETEEPVTYETPGPGSIQQQNATKVMKSAQSLEDAVQSAAEFELPDEDAPVIGEAMERLWLALNRLTGNVQNGSFEEADLAGAQNLLRQVEDLLMASADKPGLSDEMAANIGRALDDVFADLGALADTLKGSSEPPPFAHRKYVRQWLGRRGIRLGAFSRT